MQPKSRLRRVGGDSSNDSGGGGAGPGPGGNVAATASGIYPVSITATGGGVSKTVTYSLTCIFARSARRMMALPSLIAQIALT